MSNVVLLQVHILNPLDVAAVLELQRSRGGESLGLRVVHDTAVVERLQKLVDVVRLVTRLELDGFVLPCYFVHAHLNYSCFPFFLEHRFFFGVMVHAGKS